VRQEIDGGEELRIGRKRARELAQVRRDEIVRILEELALRQGGDDLLDRGRRHPEKHEAADQLEQAIDPFEDDADLERSVYSRRGHRA